MKLSHTVPRTYIVALNSTAFCGCYLHDFLLYLRDAYESDHCDESLIASNTLRIRVCFGSCSKPNVQCMPSEYRKLVLKVYNPTF